MPNVAGGDDLPKPAWTLRRWFLPSWKLDYFSKPKLSKVVVATTPHPIYNLPIEVLQRIFIFCADSEPYLPDRWHNSPLKMEPKWVSITYVCRYWRAVALEHHLLWGFLTPNLSPAWIKAFMARSAQTPVDADLRVGKPNTKRKILWVKRVTLKRKFLSVREVTSLLSDCTRLRSLRLVGSRRDVCAVLDSLRSPTTIHSLSLSILDAGPPVVLPVEMFGGLAPIRHINFTATRCIVPPHWLLRGVTHFTSSERLRLSDLLFVLRQMPALTHFTLQYFGAYWEESDAPVGPPIQLPCLTNLVVREASPHCFAMLNERLVLPQCSKRHLVLHTTSINRRVRWAEWFDYLLPVIEAMDGLQHVYIAGRAKEGTFRAWTGDATTVYEDAAFSLEIGWWRSPTSKSKRYTKSTSAIFLLDRLCDLLGATKHGRRLILEGDLGRSRLPASWWWRLLEKLPAVEELELHPNVVKALHSAWSVIGAPAVLPALRQIQLMQVRTEGPEKIIAATTIEKVPSVATLRKGFILPSMVVRRNSPRRRIARVPSSSGTCDIIPSVVQSPAIQADRMSEGLIRLLQGGTRRHQARV